MALFNYSHNYLNNIGVPFQMQKARSKGYKTAIAKSCTDFLRHLRKDGIQPETFLVSQITKFHISAYCMWLQENFMPRTHNNCITHLRSAFKQIIEFQEVQMPNPFLRVTKRETAVLDNVVISEKEFKQLIYAIGKVPSFTTYQGARTERKDNYRPYLKDAYRLCVLSGLRREEWATLTFNDIKEGENGQKLIITDNLKVQRITGKKFPPKVIPVNRLLQELLDDLEYEKLKGTDIFLIAPTRTVTTQTIMDVSSKAFTHYYKAVFGKDNFKQMKCLRKTYISNTTNTVGANDAIEFTSHSNTKLLIDHYLNKESTSKIIDNDFW